MKQKYFVGLIAFVLLVSPSISVQAADDITPTVRSEGEIALQVQAITLQLEKIRALMSGSVVESQNYQEFLIKIDETTIVQKPSAGMSEASARAQCESVAYNTDNMWKLVTCVYEGKTIYRDVFIAG